MNHTSRISPTLEGFRAALRRPSLTLAEITWRWTVGATACALFLFSIVEYLDTLSVTDGDLLLLRSKQPILVGQAVAHIVRGSFNRAVTAGLLAMLALTTLWIVAASLGRNATVRALLEYFVSRSDSVGNVFVQVGSARHEDDFAIRSASFRSLLALNFLRATLALAALLGFVAAAILAGMVSPEANPQPGLGLLVFVPLAGLICVLWWIFNWLLSLAAIFSVRNGENPMGAISAAVTFCRERVAPVFAVSTWSELAHILAFVLASMVGPLPLIFIRIAPVRVVIAGVLLITLAYFAVVDWLYTARLAGYVCILEMPEPLVVPAPKPITPPQNIMDRDEPILSDVPGLIVET